MKLNNLKRKQLKRKLALLTMEALTSKMNKCLKDLEDILQQVQEDGLQNEQFVLNFVDSVNRLSVTI